MEETVITLLVPAVLIGLNYLARKPRAQGRGWRISRMLTRFGVTAVVAGLFIAVSCTALLGDAYLENLRNLDATQRLLRWATVTGAVFFLLGFVSTLLSLLTRTWLRFDAHLRKVGPGNFARGTAHMGWTVGKSGLKLYGMAMAALVAMHFVGLRNLLFLRILNGSLGRGPLFGDPDDPRRDEDGRPANAPPAS